MQWHKQHASGSKPAAGGVLVGRQQRRDQVHRGAVAADLGEPITPTFWLAMLLVVAGVLLGQSVPQRR